MIPTPLRLISAAKSSLSSSTLSASRSISPLYTDFALASIYGLLYPSEQEFRSSRLASASAFGVGKAKNSLFLSIFFIKSGTFISIFLPYLFASFSIDDFIAGMLFLCEIIKDISISHLS